VLRSSVQNFVRILLLIMFNNYIGRELVIKSSFVFLIRKLLTPEKLFYAESFTDVRYREIITLQENIMKLSVIFFI